MPYGHGTAKTKEVSMELNPTVVTEQPQGTLGAHWGIRFAEGLES